MENYYYYSERGCIKIGNSSFNIMLLNGKGEGTFWIKTFRDDELPNITDEEFVAKFNGDKIYVYESDCSNKIIIKLNPGKYLVYRKCGTIKIIKK